MSGRAKQTAEPKPAAAAKPKPAPQRPAVQPVVVNMPQPSMPSGTQGAVLVLGAGLAGVALWSDTLVPLWDSAWNGAKLRISLPPSGIVSMVLFIGALVFVSDLNPNFAQLAFWFILALWVVYLVMHPDVVTTVAGWLTQSNPAPAQASSPTPPTTQGGGKQAFH